MKYYFYHLHSHSLRVVSVKMEDSNEKQSIINLKNDGNKVLKKYYEGGIHKNFCSRKAGHDIESFSKNKEKSSELRKLGNNYFKRDNFEKAMVNYAEVNVHY